MAGSRTAGFTAAAIGLALAGTACTGDGPDPSQVVAPTIAAANAAKAKSTGSPAIADAIARVLPSIDPESADALYGPLTAVDNQVGAGNPAALRATISAAREALAEAFINPADGPDLDVIALAIDSVEPSR